MKDIRTAVEELQQIIENSTSEHLIPDRRDGVIRIGHVIIRHSRSAGYLIIDSNQHRQIDRTFSKWGALAYAKSLMTNQDVRPILRLDQCIEKNENDILFFKNTIDSSRNPVRRDIAVDRMQIAIHQSEHARRQLEKQILDK
jgi:hypothetical protein